jgi:hypothetical protein
VVAASASFSPTCTGAVPPLLLLPQARQQLLPLLQLRIVLGGGCAVFLQPRLACILSIRAAQRGQPAPLRELVIWIHLQDGDCRGDGAALVNSHLGARAVLWGALRLCVQRPWVGAQRLRLGRWCHACKKPGEQLGQH